MWYQREGRVGISREMVTDREMHLSLSLSLIYWKDICETKHEMLLPYTALTRISWQDWLDFLGFSLPCAQIQFPVFLSCSLRLHSQVECIYFCFRHHAQEQPRLKQ